MSRIVLLAGWRRTVVKAFLKKKNAKRRPSGSHVRIEGGCLQGCKDLNRRSPLRAVPVHVLPHRLCSIGLSGNTVRNREMEGAGG